MSNTPTVVTLSQAVTSNGPAKKKNLPFVPLYPYGPAPREFHEIHPKRSPEIVEYTVHTFSNDRDPKLLSSSFVGDDDGYTDYSIVRKSDVRPLKNPAISRIQKEAKLPTYASYHHVDPFSLKNAKGFMEFNTSEKFPQVSSRLFKRGVSQYRAKCFLEHTEKFFVVDITLVYPYSNDVYVTSFLATAKCYRVRRSYSRALSVSIQAFLSHGHTICGLHEVSDMDQIMGLVPFSDKRVFCSKSERSNYYGPREDLKVEMLEENIYTGPFANAPKMENASFDHPSKIYRKRFFDNFVSATLDYEENPSFRNMAKKVSASIQNELSKFGFTFSPVYHQLHRLPLTKGFLARSIFTPGSEADVFISKNEDIMDMIQLWCSFIYAAVHVKTPLEMYSLIYMFLSTQGISMTDKMVVAASFSLLKGLYDINQSVTQEDELIVESYDDIAAPITGPLKGFVSIMNLTIDSCATDAIKELLVSASALKMIENPNVVAGIRRWFGKSGSSTVVGLIQDLVNSLMKLTRIAELIHEGIPFSEAIFQADPVQAMITRARRILLFKNRTYTGLPLEGHMDQCEYLKEAIEINTFFESVVKKMSPNSRHFKDSNSCYLELTDSILEKKAAADSKMRCTPLAFLTVSPPGTGKSSLVNLLFALMSLVRGRKHSDDLIYNRQRDQFWENYDQSYPYLRYSEAGSKHSDIVAKAGDDWLDEFCSVVDSLPYAVPMAFDKKGKVFCLAEMVVLDSNTKGLNAKQAVNNPAAIARRVIVIEPTVKPEYRDGTTPMLDASKCNDGSLPMDRWFFKVTINKALSSKIYREDVILENGDIHSFVDLITSLMKSHIAIQTDYLSVRNALDLTLYGKNRRDPARDARNEISQWLGQEIGSSLNGKDFMKIQNLVRDFADVPYKGAKKIEPRITSPYDCFDRVAKSDDFATEGLLKIINSDRESDEKLSNDDPESALEIARLAETLAAYYDSDIDSDDDLKTESFVEDVGFLTKHVFAPEMVSTVRHWCHYVYTGFHASSFALQSGAYLLGCSLFSTFLRVLIFFNPNSMTAISYQFFRYFRNVSFLIGLFSHFFGIFPALPFFLGAYCVQGFFSLSSLVTLKRLQGAYDWCSRLIGKSYRDIAGYIGFAALDFTLASNSVVLGSAVLLSVGALWFLPSWMTRFFATFRTQDKSTFRTESVSNERLNNLEEKVRAGSSEERIEIHGQKTWNSRIIVDKAKFHGDPLEMYASLSRRIVRFACLKGNVARHGYILGWCGPYAVTNTHLLFGGESDVTIMMSLNGSNPIHGGCPTENVVLSPKLIQNLGNDVSVIHLRTRKFANVAVHVTNSRSHASWADAVVDAVQVKASFSDKPTVAKSADGEVVYLNSFVYSWPDHAEGKCGLPLCYRVDTGYQIVAIHAMGSLASDEARATPLVRDDVQRAIEEIKSRCLFLQNCEEVVPNLDFSTHSSKSAFRFENLQGLEDFGKVPGPVLANQESRLIKSYLNKSVYPLFHEKLGYVADQFFGPPMMKARRNPYCNPINNGMKKMSCQRKSLDPVVLEKIISVLTLRIVSGLRSDGVKELRPFNLETAVNGDPNNPFFRRIDSSKSAGFGWRGNKNIHIPIVEEKDDCIVREPTEELKDRMANIIDGYLDGKIAGFVYSANLKDEPRELSKIESGNTRLFYASPIDALCAARMFLGPFYVLMVMYGHTFCTAIGTDMHRDGGKIYRKLKNFSQLIMEGDYSKYDLQMPIDIGLAANTVIYNVLKEFGYNEEALECVRGILSDSLFPFVEILKDVFCLPGLQPSGKYATAEDNSLRGILLQLYAWYSHPVLRHLDFFDYVLPLVYGDDLLASVKPEVSEFFNNVTYSADCWNKMGMVFTSTSKGDISEPFVDPDTMSFLKRKFKFHEAVGDYVAQLDMNSILKTLAWNLPSDSVGPDEQALSVLQSCSRELYFHLSEKKFTSLRHDLIDKYCEKFNVQFDQVHQKIPTYHFLTSEFALVVESKEENVRHFHSHMELLAEHYRKISERILEITPQYNEFVKLFDGDSVYELKCSSRYSSDKNFRDLVDKYSVLADEYETLVSTSKSVHRVRRKNSKLSLESRQENVGQLSTSSSIDHEMKMVSLQEIAGEDPDVSSTGITQSVPLIGKTLISLDEYFARPHQLMEFVWPIATPVFETFPIWQQYFMRPVIREKIHKYGLLRCNLNMRITVSGMPFHYGKLIVAYFPMFTEHPPSFNYVSTSSTTSPGLLKMLSATPGVRTIDAKDNKPLDMKFPYVNYAPLIRLYNQSTSVIGSGTGFGDINSMGQVVIASLNQLQAVSAGASSVSVMVYVWATEVELSGPTNTQMTIVTESRDERISGPIEKLSSAMVGISNAASVIPTIAPLAKASSAVFQGIQRASSLYGMSDPTLNTAPMRVKNEPFQNAVNVIGYDTGHRLTMDPKQEISVDPRKVAVEEDEMAIASFAARKGLISQVEWHHTDVQDTAFWEVAVNPITHEAVEVDTTSFVQPSPLGYVAAPFFYWRGDVDYTLQLVMSQFHRAKLGIGFTPDVSQYSLNATNIFIDGINAITVDIQEQQEITIRVEWMQGRAWLRVNTDTLAYYSIPLIVNNTQLFDYANGVLCLFPITRVQSPDDSDVTINIYNSSQNMHFNFLSEDGIPRNIDYIVESRSEIVDAPVMVLNPTSSNVGDLYLNHFGEAWMSMLQMCKRFETTNAVNVPATDADWGTVMSARMSIIPFLSPSDGVPDGGLPNIMDFVKMPFLGQSGGLKKRCRFVGLDPAGATARIQVSLDPPLDSNPSYAVSHFDDSSISTLARGSGAFVPATNGGVEFEIPFYTNNLFVPAAQFDAYGSGAPAFDHMGMRSYLCEMECRSGNSGGIFVEETAVGEDWRCFRFVCIPGHSFVSS